MTDRNSDARGDRRRLERALAGAAAILCISLGAYAQEKKPVIALSNAYYGNTWRHQMVESFQQAAEQAKKQGLVADVIVLNGDGSVAQQMAQMSDLILKHVDAIALNAASETALNGIVAKACAAGIKVVAFDSIVSAPCSYKVNFAFDKYPIEVVDYIAGKIGGKGNAIIVRGVKGSAPDFTMHDAYVAGLKKYPDIKVVATVYGEATGAIAQQAISGILPSMPHIDAVFAQGGGDDIGIAQAFEQFGGDYATHLPIISGGGGSDFIHWWADQSKRNGYSTISLNTTPGIGGAVFWLSLDILQGATPPNYMIMPVARVTQENLADYATMKPGTIVSPSYTNDWVKQNLITQKVP